MTAPEMHPDDPFDDRHRAHVAACADCAFERQVRQDFDDDLALPVPAVIPLPALPTAAPLGGAPGTATGGLGVKVALVGLGGAMLTGVAMMIAGVLGAPASPPSDVLAANSNVEARPSSSPSPAPSPSPASSAAPLEMGTPPAVPIPAVVEPPARRASAEASREAARVPAVPDEGPASLLERARDARQRHDLVSARELYGVLHRRYPASPEAAVAHVALGRLLLDRLRDPAAALREFDAYLSGPSRDLREEALVGRALALGALHRDEGERQAWQALLAEYPETLSASRASARLEVLH